MALLLGGFGYDPGFGLSGCNDYGRAIRVVGDGGQAYRYYQAFPGNLDSSEVSSRRCLRFIIDGR